MVTIDLSTEEIDFLVEELYYGEEGYIRRARQYAKESKRDKDPKYLNYFKNKKKMFPIMRAKLLTLEENEKKEQLTNLEKQLTQKFKLRDTTEHNTVRINYNPDSRRLEELRKRRRQELRNVTEQLIDAVKKEKKEESFFGKYLDEKEKKERTEFSFKRPKQNLKNNTSLFPESLNDAISEDYLKNFGVFYTGEPEQKIHNLPINEKNQVIMKELDDRDKTILNEKQRVFECGACGRRRIKSKRLRAYHPGTFKHPVLMDISDNEWICSPCKSWDYDLMVRRRKNRRGLRLKDGRILSAKNAKAFIDNEEYSFR